MNLSKHTLTVTALAGALLVPLAAGAQAAAQPAAAPASAAAPAASGSTAKRAATAPGFLAARDLPPAKGTTWTAGKVTKGLPEFEPFCLEKVLPAQGTTWHRRFGTDLDTWAVQVSVRTPNAAAARKLVTAAEKAAAGCAADWLRGTPGGTASWQDYGRLAVEEGAHVYGVHTAVPESEHGVHLIGIGRDGSTVTLVQWAQMGTLSHAPVKAFKKTTTTAVAKLH
ncbi:hypothetical protein [Streptomyces sp. NPDC047928]|uniref:hypothetical protein n=1 Tax=unclassified Streptomyces TaxID=2593676 RepID=UPI003722A97F